MTSDPSKDLVETDRPTETPSALTEDAQPQKEESAFEELPDAPPRQGLRLSTTGKVSVAVVCFWVLIALIVPYIAPYHEAHFIEEDLSKEIVADIWNHSVLPYVEEALIGNPDRVKEFDLDRLRRKAAGVPAPETSDSSDRSPAEDDGPDLAGAGP